MTGTSARAPRYLVPAELALAGVTFATVLGFSRIFSTGSFLVPMLVVGAYAHGITMVLRRRGFGVPVVALISIPGFVLLCSWIFFFESTVVGIPTASTITAVNDAFNASWDAFQNIVAPAPPLPGFVLASCAALFFAVFLADWAAFRLWSAFEAVVPASTLFIFCSLLGSTNYRVESAGVFLIALLGFLLLHRIARQETSAGWLTADIDRGSRAGLRTGAALAVIAVLAGVLFGPHLPGADSPALVSWRGGDTGPGSRVTISPLVDIQDRLINQSNVEVFTVKSNQRAYWRMTSLDTFEGDIWRSGGKYTSVNGDLDSPLPAGVISKEADQTFHITNLKVLWLPAAFEPKSVDSPSADVRYQADSSTLIVEPTVNDSDGMTYSVQSALPTFTVAQLQSANPTPPADIVKRYTALPSGFSATAQQIADQQTAQAATPYDKARALQDYFQNNFAYDLKVPKGHGENAIDAFLRDKKGYCEQFAGTFAAMARYLKLPARVAVGFTPGEQDPTDPTLYHVRGEHAHAWPEIYLGQYGWVAFEPTPNRGAPNAEAWTGRPEQQEHSTPDPSATTLPPSSVSPSVPASAVVGPLGTEVPGAPPGNVENTVQADDNIGFVPRSTAAGTGGVVLLLAVLVGLYIAIVISIKASRIRERKARATDPSARVRLAWKESVEALDLLNTKPTPTETHEEFARRAQVVLDESGPVLIDLARDVDAATYAPAVLTEDVAARAQAAATTVVAVVHAKTSSSRQLQAQLDVRPLLPTLRPSNRRRASSRDA